MTAPHGTTSSTSVFGPYSPDAPAAFDGAVLIVTPWYGGSAGGVAVSTETLAGALLRAGVPVVVLTLHPSVSDVGGSGRFGEPLVTVRIYGRDVYRRGLKGMLGYHRRSLATGLALLGMMREHRIRVAHLHYGIPEYEPLMTWLKLLRIPTVLTFRGSDVHRITAGTADAHEMNSLVASAAHITAVSEGLLSAALERFPAARGKATAVSNSAPLDIWDTITATPPDTERDTDVLFVGNLRPVKGPDFLLEAFRKVVDRRPATTLRIVGSGEMEDELRASVTRMGLEANVRFTGRAGRNDMPALYQRARVLAMPSRAEGLPLAAVEAQLYGTPVVGTDVGGIPQTVVHGETGAVVPWGDATAFADALLALLDDGAEWERVSRQAHSWARRMFDPAIVARRYLALYREMLPA